MDQNVSWKVARFHMKGLLFYSFTRERNCLAITDNKFLKLNYTLQHVDEKTCHQLLNILIAKCLAHSSFTHSQLLLK